MLNDSLDDSDSVKVHILRVPTKISFCFLFYFLSDEGQNVDERAKSPYFS